MSDFKEVIEDHYPILYKVGRLYSNDASSFDDLYQEMLIKD
jgi:DNA-directed RNA polymerase specialized sigma24 family protein